MAAQLSVRPPWGRSVRENPYEKSFQLRKNLEDSRKAFLNFADDGDKVNEKRNQQAKKISFKIKKTSSVYRRKDKINANTVQELAKKYNDLVERSEQQPKIARLVKRVSMRKQEEVARKPSLKKRPSESAISRRTSVKKVETVKTRPRLSDIPDKEISQLEMGGGVKAAIAIFEERIKTPQPPPKPKVPEKTFNLRDVATRNHERRLKIFEKRLKHNNNNASNKHEEKTDAGDLIVQVVNIPLSPPKKCDSRYETMQVKKTTNHQTENEAKEIKITDGNINSSEDSNGNQRNNLISTRVKGLGLVNCTAAEDSKQSSLINKPAPLLEVEDELQLTVPTGDDGNYSEPEATPQLPSADSVAQDDPHWEELYDFVDVNIPHTPEEQPPVPPRRNKEEKIYEELKILDEDDGYEICESPVHEENIYETLPSPAKNPPLLPRRREEPLPPRPPSRNSFTTQTGEIESNFYESIYSRKEEDAESTYESIYGCKIELDQWKSKRDSLISEQQSNSIYNRSITSWAEDVFNYEAKNGSELSGSDRSDDWVDMSDNDEGIKNSGFIILKERQKAGKRVSGWSQQMRDQWNKIPRNTNLDQGDSDSDHHYETLSALNPTTTDIQDDEFDSFDSDSESDNSFAKTDSGVDMGNTQLPEPPNQQTYVHRLAATAGKHMKKWRNWSLTKNDITKTLGRMTKRKSRTDLDGIDKIMEEKPPPLSLPPDYESPDYEDLKAGAKEPSTYQNVQFTSQDNQTDATEKTKSLGRKGFLNKFRRSMSISGETPELSLNGDSKAKSTFYLTETIDVDKKEEREPLPVPVVNLTIKNKTSPARPRVPPPPAPKPSSPTTETRKKGNSKRSTSWYSECGVFKNAEPPPHLPRRPNTFWYAEVGLYRSNNSTPSTSSTENSGSLTNVIIKPPDIQEDTDDYYNVKNENDYYNGSIQSSDSYETKKDEAFNSLPGDLQLRLQDEPLYQFYDAAVLESVCKDGTSDFEYDGYEEVGKKNSEVRLSTRPSAMELVAPKRNNVSVARTLWCEIPEVIQSTVLSTLSLHQKKLQEAKFEMLTSEASYLNSLNVLADHFVKKFEASDVVSQEEREILFGKVLPVKECSEKLLLELEKCWQENILLHGICEIVKKHAEENFYVYVSYCENQILLDRTLRKLKERPGFVETLKQLESSTVCHLLTLHSFLMLPMQRVTRWPLLLDAVLKRLSRQDEEYLSCQYALATLNKIVNQCNEGARKMERITEMQKIALQLEFGRGVTPITLVTGSRWLVRSGPLVQMQARGDDVKLTFGKRFSKVPIHLFLFNDVLIVAKSRGDESYVIQHYCYRSYLEINSETLSCLPSKDSQGRHLIFLTILENHDEKTIELLLSCNSETDKERWLEALSPPKSENPDETLYECWDCPQVTVAHTYTANQPDELALSRGDIINVTRKMADGWYHGERIRDGETGWFPANYTVEVANPHVRARNLKQRYRLLAFSESYLKSK